LVKKILLTDLNFDKAILIPKQVLFKDIYPSGNAVNKSVSEQVVIAGIILILVAN